MNITLSKHAREALAFQEKTLPSGLVLRVLPMPGYSAAHVVYATHFGSIHRTFIQEGKRWELPAGVAHFLEHKMFENEDGTDAFTLYAQTGASANAYTGFDRTSYVFTATSEMEKNLDILLSFVSRPHFTAETVAKEQGIIGQEIKMYDDIADLRAFYAALQGMYHAHPLREDIGGTVESIAEITPELLYACCEAFYNPGNMVLAAAGNITLQQLEDAANRAGLQHKSAPPTQRIFPPEPKTIARAENTFTMPVALPILTMGFKETPPEGDATHAEAVCSMLGELICGETSPLYRRLYDEGLIQPEFSGEYGSHEGCLYMMFMGAVTDPEKVRQEILDEITRLRQNDIDEAQFDLCKKMMYGEAICDIDNPERMAASLAGSYFRGRIPAAEMEAVAALALQDVQAALKTMLHESRLATVIVCPAE